MHLLIVGNGFDLAHELPTRYSDFLDFMTLYISKNCNRWKYWGTTDWADESSWYEYYGSVLQEVHSKAVKNPQVNNLIEKYGEKFKSAIEENKSLERFYENSFSVIACTFILTNNLLIRNLIGLILKMKFLSF